MSNDSPLAWVAIDFLCCLLLVVYTLIATPAKTPSIDTFGQYAVEVAWPAAQNDDVDTYVQDPAGNLAWFADSDVGLMHLEHDDLGRSSDVLANGRDVAVVNDNEERVVLRGVIPGEVTVNVHAYQKVADGPVPVRVAVYRLRGADRALLRRTVRLAYQGQERTVFRFTLDWAGRLVDHNELEKPLVSAASDGVNA
jgi:hypothetical protein